MELNEENIRLLLGIKIKRERLSKGISPRELSSSTGISISYLNEIEKGKKSPKASKIALIADKLGVDYNWLVSLDLGESLSELQTILQENLIQKLPLQDFGLDKNQLIDLFTSNPEKVSAFFSMIIHLARVNDIDLDTFYKASINSIAELNHFQFPELEDRLKTFLDEHEIFISAYPSIDELQSIIEKQFNIRIRYFHPQNAPVEVYTEAIISKNAILINEILRQAHKKEILARCLAYLILDSQKVQTIHIPIKITKDFNSIWLDYSSSIISRSLLMDKSDISVMLKGLFTSKQWKPWILDDYSKQHNIRINNIIENSIGILSDSLNIKSWYLSEFEQDTSNDVFSLKSIRYSQLNKEIISEIKSFHVCRRLKSYQLIEQLSRESSRRDVRDEVLIDAAVLEFPEQSILEISIAQIHPLLRNKICSISLGIDLSKDQQKSIAFLEDPKVKTIKVGSSCEKCGIISCEQRMSDPIILQEAQKEINYNKWLADLTENYGI